MDNPELSRMPGVVMDIGATEVITDERETVHDRKELTEVYTRAKGVPLIQGTNVVYFCPHCQKVLGFGQGRMI